MPHPRFSDRTLVVIGWMFYAMGLARGMPDGGEADLRTLLLDEPNQELVDHLGTRYEVVYPHQIRKDWGRGLSTRLSAVNGTITHVQETTLLIETLDYKLQLDLELNTKLFAPTLVQLLYFEETSPTTEHKLPENCYYHAKVRNHPDAKAAFRTCSGIRGIIHLGEKIFFIHPLHGELSGKSPHLLYHHFPEEDLTCGSTDVFHPDQPEEESPHSREKEERFRNKYVELALVVDRSLLQKFKSPVPDATSTAIEVVNYVDMLYRPLDTSVSLVYLELWLEDQAAVSKNASAFLRRFEEYALRRISRISVDATHLLTGVQFEDGASGLAFVDSICTNAAVGLTRVENVFRPHLTAFVLAHMLGHNLGMNHDPSGCECPEAGGCVMENPTSILSSTAFSRCSFQDYQRTLYKGYGACLYNMPNMRTSICGNGILEEPEQCDCGTVEECMRSNPCCDPATCRLIKHAQCSSGSCCRKCKLLSPDHLCRPSKGECDIPEFCDGQSGQCPEDLFKRNGATCSEGLGYCFQGVCPVLKQQCQAVWGKGAEAADSICFERLNVQGTPNGNCGTDARGDIAKCTDENSLCGFLQCSHGKKIPASPIEEAPIHFVVHKINFRGSVHECKARTFSTAELEEGLVRDGTKCGYQKLCINQTCRHLKNLVSGKCPMEEHRQPCSGHGICTNVNSCFCDDGWKGLDCSLVDEEANWRVGKDSVYYDSDGRSDSENPYYGQNELKLNPNLAITVIAASVVIGVGLVVIVILLFFYRKA